jgi:hypothetical protein
MIFSDPDTTFQMVPDSVRILHNFFCIGIYLALYPRLLCALGCILHRYIQ